MGPGGSGVVVGQPARLALASVAVSVRWDGTATVSDARTGTLRRTGGERPEEGEQKDALLQFPTDPAEMDGDPAAAVQGEGSGAVLPYHRRRSTQAGEANPADTLRAAFGEEHVPASTGRLLGVSLPLDGTASTGSEKRSSQWQFAERTQTVIVFDWDDTLFPTSFLFDSLRLDLAVPLAHQRRLGTRAREVTAKLEKCENQALKILQQSHAAGQVVVVTLAVKGWVEQACRCFYPKVGELMRKQKIKVVSARQEQSADGKVNVSKGLVKAKCRSDEEYWGLLKGQAISREIEQFYSQYEGQSWKNVLSIGDSQFERYGLLAASTAYMQKKRMSQLDAQPYAPAHSGAWQKTEVYDNTEHDIRLRVKCCKLLGDPDMDELVVELNTISKWLDCMVQLDEGFDIDFEALKDVEHVARVEAVLRGERPVSDLPELPKP